ncbi:AAA family ATPase [Butyrivibrio sp. MC2013]|uniref:AAA family ATPase n=1 Tax=Butyrivibrio sp. MC2013 TaxID=1280686 RepID=UPI000412F6D1|nr:AAA family ATPase [Butyrivibrio sp. MC2013]
MSDSRIDMLIKEKSNRQLTYGEIAQSSGLSLSTVQKVLEGKVASPRSETIEALESALFGDIHYSLMGQREISIGNQDFEAIVRNGYFYIDKTCFIRNWWESADVVTLITRPRRFGKTLNMSMLDYFFSNRHENSAELFEGLEIWKDEKYRTIQGRFPVLFISFAAVKGNNYDTARQQIIQEIVALYRSNDYLIHSEQVNDMDRQFWDMVGYDMNDATAASAIRYLCELMSRYYGSKVLVLLDEYDTPIHEAYTEGFWDQMTSFIRNLFNATFKTNPFLERAILTGITRVSKESIFSDLNNLKIDSMIGARYDKDFGFTEAEVRAALSAYGLSDQYEAVKEWYDGFRIGDSLDIYNPWSVTRYLDAGVLDNYWANTSENSMVEKLIREGGIDVKKDMESLLAGESVSALIDNEIVFDLIDRNESGIYSLLLAAGYLKAEQRQDDTPGVRKKFSMSLTNLEVKHVFEDMIKRWFEGDNVRYNDFIKALLLNDLKYMNRFMNEVAENTFSIFDSGSRPSVKTEPEKFYHGFVLGLIVELQDKYHVRSNRESGFGRYDVCLEPREPGMPAYILEFKVHDPDDEDSLEDTVQKALEQIREKNYDADLIARGVKKKDIHHYGFAFEGKKVLIG